MSADAMKPIFSSIAGDPDSDKTVGAFVVGIAERIDTLQDAEVCGDLAQLAALASGLIVESAAAGFDALAEVGKLLETACFQEDAKAARQQIVELTDLSQRIRLGHKSAL